MCEKKNKKGGSGILKLNTSGTNVDNIYNAG